MLQRIEKSLPGLSVSESKVGRWILEHPQRCLEESLAQVAGAAGTSEPTVVRFCRSVGLQGFRELRLQLARSLARPLEYLHVDVRADDSTGEAARKVFDRSVHALVTARDRLDMESLEPAVAAIAGCQRLDCYGLGSSGLVAGDAQHKFFRLGIPTTHYTDVPTIIQAAAVLKGGGVALVVSHTGHSAGLHDACDIARQNGATIVAITARGSPLAPHADVPLCVDVIEDTSLYTPMISRIVHLALVDALQVGVALRMGEPALDNLKRTKDVMQRLSARDRLRR